MFWGITTSMRGQRVSEVPRAQRFFVWRRSTRGLIGQKINLNQPPNHQLKDHHLKSKVTFDRYRKNLSPTQGNHSWTSSSRSAKFFQAGKDGMGPPKEASDRGLGSLEFKLLSDEHLTKGALGEVEFCATQIKWNTGFGSHVETTQNIQLTLGLRKSDFRPISSLAPWNR